MITTLQVRVSNSERDFTPEEADEIREIFCEVMSRLLRMETIGDPAIQLEYVKDPVSEGV